MTNKKILARNSRCRRRNLDVTRKLEYSTIHDNHRIHINETKNKTLKGAYDDKHGFGFPTVAPSTAEAAITHSKLFKIKKFNNLYIILIL